ncbi:hypothetical protein ABFA25_08635 [Mycobacterium lepromatosis]|nr:hypothetical protein [Mycobacterium lepromatosis]
MGLADDIGEYDSDMVLFPAQLWSLAFRGSGDFAPHMLAEKILHAFAFSQSIDRGIGPTL